RKRGCAHRDRRRVAARRASESAGPAAGPAGETVAVLDRSGPVAVYVDAAIWSWSGLKWCHLLADDIDELHRFAARLGIKRSSFQSPPKTATPHYDLTGYERTRAITLGALACNREQIIAVRRRIGRAAA